MLILMGAAAFTIAESIRKYWRRVLTNWRKNNCCKIFYRTVWQDCWIYSLL